MRLRGVVEDERVAELVDGEPSHRRIFSGLARARFGDDARGGATNERRRVFRIVTDDFREPRVLTRHGVLVGAHDRARSRLDEHVRRRRRPLGREHLRGIESHELRARRRRVRRLARHELARRHVERGDAEFFAVRRERDEPMIFLSVESAVVEDDAGRHDADDLARNDPLRLRRIRHLLADGDFETLLEEPLNVRARRVIRHAGHGNRLALFFVFVARGQREIERARGDGRVVVEELVEISEPKEKERIGVLRFRLEELPHDGRRRVEPRLRHQ